jgi:hypothetical protein
MTLFSLNGKSFHPAKQSQVRWAAIEILLPLSLEVGIMSAFT